MIMRNKGAFWRWQASGTATPTRLSIHTFIAMLLASAATASGQSVSEIGDFMLYNACRPMRVAAGSSLSTSDGSTIDLLPDRIQAVAERRLRERGLYPDLGSESNRAHLVVSVNIDEVCAETRYAYDITLRYKKLVTDAATGVEHTATTWRSGSGGSGATDSEFIVESFVGLLDGFIEEYLRVNEEDCH